MPILYAFLIGITVGILAVIVITLMPLLRSWKKPVVEHGDAAATHLARLGFPLDAQCSDAYYFHAAGKDGRVFAAFSGPAEVLEANLANVARRPLEDFLPWPGISLLPAALQGPGMARPMYRTQLFDLDALQGVYCRQDGAYLIYGQAGARVFYVIQR